MEHSHGHGKKSGKAFMLGLTLGAIGAAAASYHFLRSGPQQMKDKREMKRRFEVLKDQLIARMESSKEISKEAYEDLVDELVDAYAKTRKVADDKRDILTERLKARYAALRREIDEARNSTEDETLAE
jgi:gas vesicle protein